MSESDLTHDCPADDCDGVIDDYRVFEPCPECGRDYETRYELQAPSVGADRECEER